MTFYLVYYITSQHKSSHLYMIIYLLFSFFFFFNDTATTEIYTLSLHDASSDLGGNDGGAEGNEGQGKLRVHGVHFARDRKSTRLNSSHSQISYAVFCLKKKNITTHTSSPSQYQYPIMKIIQPSATAPLPSRLTT